ncbi:DUF1735 domain-containing protein [Zobellia galactanivorans]|uniref:DUF1735 domain-containing protein n=1 Tax=Zobellia galactanivorans (strain DSM 12802 / CCUG 47099 / CIP 106680 / NCIMB 13871 / Dsij) TaxID=63186 RepID=UPI001C06AD0A|nr:DUF1735 domain-containing protein [Zobellia galactanivorans]MBU3025533.1 DUF1735 domain-containing protein [Zobellia galactanivorans]
MKYSYSILTLVLALVFSCEEYEDYVVDTAGYTDVYFPKPELQRSIVSGEGLSIKVGVYLGGLRENKEDHQVKYVIDETLLVDTPYTLMPDDYYSLESDEITVPKGSFQGLVDVKFDSLKLAQDTLLRDFNYALPFKIVSTSVDSILEGKEQTIIPLKLMNTYEGNFYQVGSLKQFFTATKVLDTVYVYGDDLDGPNTPIRTLSSIMMDTVDLDGIGPRGGDGYHMRLKVDPKDNSVEIIADTASVYQVSPNGKSTWDPNKRKFVLSYKYSDGERDYEVEEKLTFRNRVRDGINEWRWEGFPGN